MAARLYDFLTERFEQKIMGEHRRQLFQAAHGRVLDVGAGTGANLPHFRNRPGLQLLLIDPSAGMLERARHKAARHRMPAQFCRASGEALPVRDGTFDTVVFTLALCTIPDAVKALQEARRVLHADGRLVLLEHVRSSEPRLARWQDRVEPLWRGIMAGCHPNRDTRQTVEAAGFEFEWCREAPERQNPVPIIRPLLEGVAHPQTRVTETVRDGQRVQ